MLIVCPSCATSYQVEPASLGATGRSVRCVRCRNVWFASNTNAMAAVARAHRDDIGTLLAGAAVAPVVPTPGSSGEPVIEAAPPLAPPDIPPEPAAATAEATAEALPPDLIRDDRGPAPLPEAKTYEPPQPVPAVSDAGSTEPGSPAATDAASVIDVSPVPSQVPADIETLAARRTRRRAKKSRGKAPAVVTVALALLAINAGLIAYRAEVVRFLPQTAALFAAIGLPVNLRELAFTDIVTHRETHDGVEVLVVEGVIKSQSRRIAEVPRLRFAVRNGDGHELHTWTALPDHNALGPGGTMPFRTRLASPPPETQAVLVRFFNRRDFDAGTQ